MAQDHSDLDSPNLTLWLWPKTLNQILDLCCQALTLTLELVFHKVVYIYSYTTLSPNVRYIQIFKISLMWTLNLSHLYYYFKCWLFLIINCLLLIPFHLPKLHSPCVLWILYKTQVRCTTQQYTVSWSKAMTTNNFES